ncbi:MAG TPA: zinc ABC transporter substrate-binding protein [Streptosporangiaceae bacterium]|nr:zinc ABC transporter substrate-binding protein [Streptosporangiaceae bacterium]
MRAPRLGIPSIALVIALAASGGLAATACSTAGEATLTTHARRVIQVVAAENFWGSIAAQIGGKHVHVISIITNPNTDPHSYEPTVADAKVIAGAQLAIENGVGYDPWMTSLLAADGAGSGEHGTPNVLNVATVVGVSDGANPHRWYNPADVQEVIRRLVTDFSRLDPADKVYFARQRIRFNTVGLREYHRLIATIRQEYHGTPVGASESIFAMLAPALGLRLITPYSFLKAISEGTEVSAADKLTIDNQIEHHLIKIYVYNSQNVTPDVQAQLALAKAAHIPVTTITETLAPPTDTYQAWQVRQLRGIEAALRTATGR